MPLIQFVPWRQISSWHCSSCGSCCRDYSVVLNFAEWLQIAQNFGSQATVAGGDKLFIKRVDDGRCTFLCQFNGTYLCALQGMKPNACKIWPFKVLSEPRYGDPNLAALDFAGKKLYIYADSSCTGLRYGSPCWEFSTLTVKEFAGIALGICGRQNSSTGKVNGVGLRRF